MTHDHDDPTPEPGGEAYVLAMIQVLVPNEAADPDRPIDTVDAVRAVIGPKPNIFDVGYGAWGQLLSESSQARLDPAPTPRGERPTVEVETKRNLAYAEMLLSEAVDAWYADEYQRAEVLTKRVRGTLRRLAAPPAPSVPEDVRYASCQAGSWSIGVEFDGDGHAYGHGPDWESALLAARAARDDGGA